MPRIKVSISGDEAEAWMEDPISKLAESEGQSDTVREELPSDAVPGRLDIGPRQIPHFIDGGQRVPDELPETAGELDELRRTVSESLTNFRSGVQRDLKRIEEQLAGELQDVREDLEESLQGLDDAIGMPSEGEGIANRPHLQCHLYYSGPTVAWLTAVNLYINGQFVALIAARREVVGSDSYYFLRYKYTTGVATIDFSGVLPSTNYEQYIKKICFLDWDGDHISLDDVEVYHEGEFTLNIDIPDSHYHTVSTKSMEETHPSSQAEHMRRLYDFLCASSATGPIDPTKYGTGDGQYLMLARWKDNTGTGPAIPTLVYIQPATGPKTYVTDVYVTGPTTAPQIKMTKETAWVFKAGTPYAEVILTGAPCPTGP